MTEGRKDDATKPRVELVPPCFIRAAARALAHGADKYTDPDGPNYLKVDGGERRYYAAALRHLMAWFEGEHTDTDSGLAHLDCAAASVAILIHREHEQAREPEPEPQVLDALGRRV